MVKFKIIWLLELEKWDFYIHFGTEGVKRLLWVCETVKGNCKKKTCKTEVGGSILTSEW
jgi:hypothetical protein